jgi:hypothetical protein
LFFVIALIGSFVKFHLTQPVLNEGWRIAVATQDVNINFFSWLDPFDWSLWIVVLAEIYIASLILVLAEGYGTNENLWMDNIFSTCYDSFYWYANSFEGIAVGINFGRQVVHLFVWSHESSALHMGWTHYLRVPIVFWTAVDSSICGQFSNLFGNSESQDCHHQRERPL